MVVACVLTGTPTGWSRGPSRGMSGLTEGSRERGALGSVARDPTCQALGLESVPRKESSWAQLGNGERSGWKAAPQKAIRSCRVTAGRTGVSRTPGPPMGNTAWRGA